MRIFQFKDIHYPFEGKFVEVEAVAHIIVCRYSFGIIVDHNTAIPLFTNGIQCLYTAPVKLYGRPDTIRTGTEYNDGSTVAEVMNIISDATIRQIQVISLCRIFGSKSVYLLHYRNNADTLTMIAHIKDTVFHVSFITDGTGYLEIGETLYLGFFQQFQRQIGYLFVVLAPLFQLFAGVHDVHQLLQEPLIDLRQFVHLINGISGTESFGYDKDTLVRRFTERLVYIRDNKFLILYETMHPLSYHTQTFLNGFFKSTANSHHLAY